MIPKVTLSALFQIGSSKRVLKSQWRDSGVPFYRGREVTKLSQDGCVENDLFIDEDLYEQLLKKYGVPTQGDIVITAIGTIGNTYIVKEDDKFYFKDASVLWLKRTSDVVSEYINYWFKSTLMREQLEAGNGATVDTLTISKLQSLIVPIPSVSEQKRIVAILDQAFADIDQARATAETNLKNARELFDSYLQQVFSHRGEGWKTKKWGDICKFVRGPFGGSLKKSVFKESGYVVYEQKHAIHDHFNQLRYFIDENKFLEMKRFEVKPGEIIMSCSGVTLGRVAVIPQNIPKGIINQALLKLTPTEDVDVHFLKYWIRSKLFQDIIFEYAGGAAIPNVPSAKIMKEIELSLPSKVEQLKIVESIEQVKEGIEKVSSLYKQKVESLDELKKSILQKAFTGELTKSKGIAS